MNGFQSHISFIPIIRRAGTFRRRNFRWAITQKSLRCAAVVCVRVRLRTRYVHVFGARLLCISSALLLSLSLYLILFHLTLAHDGDLEYIRCSLHRNHQLVVVLRFFLCRSLSLRFSLSRFFSRIFRPFSWNRVLSIDSVLFLFVTSIKIVVFAYCFHYVLFYYECNTLTACQQSLGT